MQKRFFFTVLLAIFALYSMAEGLTYLSTAEFKAKVCYYDLASSQQPQWKYIGDKPCLIDFSTTWCGWCKKLHPILEQVAKQYEGKVYVYTLDAEKEPEVAALFGVRSYPTVVFCPMEGGPRIAQGYHELDYWQEAIKQVFGIEENLKIEEEIEDSHTTMESSEIDYMQEATEKAFGNGVLHK